MPDPAPLAIRPATAADIPLVLDFIQALAEYEASRAINERLLATDPKSRLWQEDKTIIEEAITAIRDEQGAAGKPASPR